MQADHTQRERSDVAEVTSASKPFAHQYQQPLEDDKFQEDFKLAKFPLLVLIINQFQKQHHSDVQNCYKNDTLFQNQGNYQSLKLVSAIINTLRQHFTEEDA